MEEDGQIDWFAKIANIPGPVPDLRVMKPVDNRGQIGIERRLLMRAEGAELECDPGACILGRQLVGPGGVKGIMEVLRTPDDGKLWAIITAPHRRSIH